MAPSTTEQSFRENLSQFRWARGNNNDSQQSPSQGQSNSPFSRFYNAIGGAYIPLRSGERSNEDEAYFALSRWERLVGFLACLAGAAICFAVAFFTLPFLAIRPAKFALAFRYPIHARAIYTSTTDSGVFISLGSLLVMFGFSVLIGPLNHAKHLISKERLPFSIAYLSSLGLTLYFSLGPHSYIGSLISAIVQVVALVSYILAYFPGGAQTLRFGGQMALRGAGNVLPV
ncbi:hypothetical protein EW146_g2706 [Bondarzewia mesenterica]|uniref:Protein transport protein SFT2 n=1 Tax=Bondarzewia mesenterica TaxID=1095465 RepID=A0A4S4LZW6_9AGAM|nr:hypothetical protein EW146_g2706 [Bondarzewia mesenterica]